VRAAGFPANTVPALKIDGKKLQGSRSIGKALDQMRPEPPLYPSDPQLLTAVEEAERWGDEQLQGAARRIIWWVLRRDRSGMASISEGAKLGVPVKVAVATGGPIVAMAARFTEATDENVQAALASLPAWLDQIDSMIAEGVLGAEPPNAADLQISTSLRLLMTLDDLRPVIEGRPAGQNALRAVPEFPGRVPPGLPQEWLPA
jgi:glutathione S-transferase